MKTNNNPTQAKRSISRADFIELNEKVRACNTYKHGYFVLMTKRKMTGTKTEILDTLTMSEPKTSKECYADKKKYEAIMRQYKRTSNIITTISVQNIFERYDLWTRGHGEPKPRAQQWQDIKASAQA